ncbi:MAG TPA: hypothetical protein VM925_08960 [Labilithrix sp.]|nr:hypothetical protein [Labilithrix sp.]
MHRRKLLQLVAYGLGAASLGRVLGACMDAGSDLAGERVRPIPEEEPPTPTDQDEHVPGTSPPVDPGDSESNLPNPSWEARAKQLEDEQRRIYNRGTFSRGDAGKWTGKENSHEPRASIVSAKGEQRLAVTVEHVMGSNLLDGGAPADAGYDADASTDAATTNDAGGSDAAAPSGSPAALHYVTTIYLRAMIDGVDTVVGLWEFVATDPAPPTVHFPIPKGVTEVTAYEWCTLHGLWKSQPLGVA